MMIGNKGTSIQARRFTVFLTLMAAALCVLPSALNAQNKPAANNMADVKDSANDIWIHKEIAFKASPKQLYETLLNSKQFSDCTKKSFNNFSASSARIDSTTGGAFSLFDGVIFGRILELVSNQRIVEAWRVADWPAGIYSVARFELKPDGAGTLLVFDHIGFPVGLKAHLTTGWQEHYWDALKKYLQ